jgi:carboxypeptidase Taq
MMAAQQWAAIERKNPALRGDVAKGSFDGVNSWRRDNIWSKASQFSTQEILIQATGEPLQAKYFISHLKQRYLS